jgi:hypothetical protein
VILHKLGQCLLLLGCLLVLIGCTDNSGLADVSGAVTIDGAPAEEGSISFFPVDGQGQTTGAQITQGRYQSKAPLGESRVEIRVPKAVGQKKLYDTPDSPVQDVFEEVLPEKYNSNSELRLNAQSGRNEKDWNLTTQ